MLVMVQCSEHSEEASGRNESNDKTSHMSIARVSTGLVILVGRLRLLLINLLDGSDGRRLKSRDRVG
jgi:hypothetical protein